MHRTLALAGAIALSILALSAPPSAGFGSYCSKPRPPWCIDQSSTYKDQFAFSGCRSDVQSYVSDVDRYVDCLSDEQRDAINTSNRVVKRFNCKASGQSYCL